MDSTSQIPHKIHVSWPDKHVLGSQTPMVLNGIKNLELQNPDWQIKISNDREVDEFIKDHIAAADYNLLADRHIVEKTDLWRLLKIYHEGGLYTDIDRPFNVPLAEEIDKKTVCFLPIYRFINFSQDIVLGAPGQAIHRRAIELNLERRRLGITNLYDLGPPTYFHAITDYLLGEMIDQQPPRPVFDKLQVIIESTSGLQTMVEGGDRYFAWEKGRLPFQSGNQKHLYEESGVLHWAKSGKVE